MITILLRLFVLLFITILNIPELRTLTSSGTISEAKKKNLLSLCHCNAIPKSHWAFYANLKSASTNATTERITYVNNPEMCIMMYILFMIKVFIIQKIQL